MRLDVYLFENKMAKSRSEAAGLIEAGLVTIGGKTAAKAAQSVLEGDEVKVTGALHPYVGRGGMKLAAALEAFGVSVRDCVCADIGASTGGFTDCLLQNGAARVFAIDSGTGQLDKRLLSDSRVINLERTNARELSAQSVGECDIVVCDVSFISQELIIPSVVRILKPGGLYISLVKPQFECGRAALSKGGVVRDKKQHALSIRRVMRCMNENGIGAGFVIPSPVTGGDGNREFLIIGRRGGEPLLSDDDIIRVTK